MRKASLLHLASAGALAAAAGWGEVRRLPLVALMLVTIGFLNEFIRFLTKKTHEVLCFLTE